MKPIYYCAALLISHSLYAQVLPVDPHRTWKTFPTDHFEIIYEDGQRDVAEIFAAEAERAAKIIDEFLDIKPSGKVPITLADVTDSSNGSATFLPRNQIELYPVLPKVMDSIGEYSNWAFELVLHEYTHILNFEPTSGFMDTLRTFLGAIIRPAAFNPRWYLEGLAVEAESRLTSGGRGRSFHYSAFRRAQFEASQWGNESIDKIGVTSIPTWPRGARPYTYGYLLMHHLSEVYAQKTEIYSLLNNRYGGRFPWIIDPPVQDVFNKDWSGLLDDMYDFWKPRLESEMKSLEKTAAKKGDPLPEQGYFVYGPQISPDGLKLVAISSRYNEKIGIQVWTRNSTSEPFTAKDPHKYSLTGLSGISQIAWRPDSRKIVYNYEDTWQNYNEYSDLYEIDISEILEKEDSKENRLTEGLRAHEATVLPDNRLVFVVSTIKNNELYISDSDGKNPKMLFSPPFGDRLSNPRSYKTGVIYSHRDSTGMEWIEYYDLNSNLVKKITAPNKSKQMHVMPDPDRKSDSAFYFAAADSGVMNIYRHDGRSYQPVTNVTTYATSPTFDPWRKKLIFSRMTGDGFQLEEMEVSEKSKVQLATINADPLYKEAKSEKGKIRGEERSYWGTQYLFPTYIFPFVWFAPGGSLFEASTSGSDPLRHHEYTLAANYDTRVKEPGGVLLYENNIFPFRIDFIGYSQNLYITATQTKVKETYLTLDTRHFLSSTSNKFTIGPEFTYRSSQGYSYFTNMAGPGARFMYYDVSSPRDYQISPMSGQYLAVGYDYFLPTMGKTSYQNINGKAGWYFSKFLPENNVIFLKTDFWISPPQDDIYSGSQVGGGEFYLSLTPPSFLVRGYPYGEFIGSSIVSANFEYRLPFNSVFKGWGTFPAFLEKWHGAVVVDSITLNGAYYDSNYATPTLVSTKMGTFYTSAGGEFRGDMIALYNVPLTVRLGAYYGFNNQANGGFSTYLGFGVVR